MSELNDNQKKLHIVYLLNDVLYGSSKIEEEKKRIDQALTLIRAAWAKYGCSILFDGWRETERREALSTF